MAEAVMLENPETDPVSHLALLLKDFAQREPPRDGNLLSFIGPDGKDAYNCTIDMIGGQPTLASRLEPRWKAPDAETRFYRKNAAGAYEEIPSAPVFAMEDPALEQIGAEIVVSGVRAFWRKKGNRKPKLLGFHTDFYRGKHLKDLHLFAKGPPGMKDIELLELPDKRIFVLTRPQGGSAGLGKIAYTIIDTLEELSPQRLTEATIIPGQFAEGEWGGGNKMRLLDEKTIGVLGHIAFKDKSGALHYYAMTFTFDLETRTASPLRIIAIRKNYPPSAAKSPQHRDVVFPGVLLEKSGNRFVLYAGLSDAVNGTAIVFDPFGITALRAH